MTRGRRDAIFGAVPRDGGARFRVWAPQARRVQLHRRTQSGAESVSEMAAIDHPLAPGTWELAVDAARPGDRYAYAVDGRDPRPDPAARFLPDGVHGWAEVIDPRAFAWTDDEWRGLEAQRAVIYELHVGTFTPEGTFRGAAKKLPYLRDLGVTAIELMPVADFPGARNWGYDGVAPFAPSRAYGRPDDLRALIDAAHRAGLAVLLDVVYNHLGPEGAYLPEVSPAFLTHRHATPWGGAVNLDDEASEGTRAFLLDNALHWIDEYHMDGLRLDATHALFDARPRHFVAELAEAVHAAADPPPLVYAEDHRNMASLVEPADRRGWGLDGVWADDFHHVVRALLAGDRHGYYADFRGTTAELSQTLRQGWLYTGQHSGHSGAPRGTDPATVPMFKAVVCVQNHDQVGNRALGDRLHHAIDAAAWRAATTLLLTAPMTPLLFMGQEWSASTPFQFFTDFGPEIGALVRDGRRREFRDFPEFATDAAARRIPDPQAAATFEASRLRWDEHDEPGRGAVLALHRALLQLRAGNRALHGSRACAGEAEPLGDDGILIRRQGIEGAADVFVAARLRGSGPLPVAPLHDARIGVVLDTEDAAFAVDPRPARVDRANGVVDFQRPGALVLSAGA